MKKIKHLVTSTLLFFAMSVGLFAVAQPAYALDCAGADAPKPACQACAGVTAAGGSCDPTAAGTGFSGLIKNVINILSVVVGAISVIMIVIGGFRYVVSGGDSNGTAGAKNTIMYALIGLIVVIFAQAIVAFVLDRATAPTSSTSATP